MTTPARQPQLTELDVLEILRDCKDIQDARRMVKDRLATHTSPPALNCDNCPELMAKAREHGAKAAREDECERIYGLFNEVERLHLNGMAYPDLYNEMVARIKFIHTEPLSKDGRKKKPPAQQEQP